MRVLTAATCGLALPPALTHENTSIVRKKLRFVIKNGAICATRNKTWTGGSVTNAYRGKIKVSQGQHQRNPTKQHYCTATTSRLQAFLRIALDMKLHTKATRIKQLGHTQTLMDLWGEICGVKAYMDAIHKSTLREIGKLRDIHFPQAFWCIMQCNVHLHIWNISLADKCYIMVHLELKMCEIIASMDAT